MKAATRPRNHDDPERLLVFSHNGWQAQDLKSLPEALEPGDCLVVNDAATFPASLQANTSRGEPIEVRLAGEIEPLVWRAVLFGRGDWRTPTEHREPPPFLGQGERLFFAEGFHATVRSISDISPRLVNLELPEGLWARIYELGHPVQYSYLRNALELWSVQTAYASRPRAAEMPSAGRPLRWELLLSLRRRGVRIIGLTHATGLSSTGDPAIDRLLPFPEVSDIPLATIEAVERARSEGGRVVAVGTSVTRALEGRALAGRGKLFPGSQSTDLILGPESSRQVVDGILTGMHEIGESHFRLLEAFVPREELRIGQSLATQLGFESHEFGDSCLLLPW